MIHVYTNVADFLQNIQPVLEIQESKYNLMLGICLELRSHPENFLTNPYLAVVEQNQVVQSAAVMTSPSGIIIYSEKKNCKNDLEEIVHSLINGHWKVPAVNGVSSLSEDFARIWARATGLTYSLQIRMKAYELRKVINSRYESSEVLYLSTEETLTLIAEWFFHFNEETQLENISLEESYKKVQNWISKKSVYLLKDKNNNPVSMAIKMRPTRRGVSIGYVYTPPNLRCHGYAGTCVAKLSQLLLDEGKKFCSLFTDLAHPTSNNIYQKIGYVPIEDFSVFKFTDI